MQRELYWCAAQLKPNALSIAQRHLQRQEFRTFCPKRAEAKRRGAKFVEQTVPLFPGYIFVQLAPQSSAWRALNGTRGLTRVIPDTRGYPAAMPEEFMSALLARCDQTGLFAAPDTLEAGDKIRILSGPFADTITRIEAADSQGRVEILLDLMGRAVRTHLPSTAVEKLNTDAE